MNALSAPGDEICGAAFFPGRLQLVRNISKILISPVKHSMYAVGDLCPDRKSVRYSRRKRSTSNISVSVQAFQLRPWQ